MIIDFKCHLKLKLKADEIPPQDLPLVAVLLLFSPSLLFHGLSSLPQFVQINYASLS